MPELRQKVLAHSLFTRTRLYSLYSDFRKLKDHNPEGFDANLIAWKSLIEQLFQTASFKNYFVLDTIGLLEDLTLPEYGKPAALDFVLDQLIETGDLLVYSKYITETDSIYSSKWVRPALSWAIKKFLIDTSYKIGKNGNLKAEKLISKKRLELYADELLNLISRSNSNSNSVFTTFQLRKYIDKLSIKIDGQAIHLSDLDHEILMKYLSRDAKKILIDKDFVKFGDEEITEQDKGITQIKSTVETIQKKNDELSEKIDLVSIKLKQSLKTNNKELSKNLLKSKKIAENSLSKQLSSLNQLESVLLKIDEASTNLQLVSVLETGSTLLKGLNSQIGGIERVEQLMNELEDEHAQSEEINEELTRLGSADIDDDAITEEFERMAKEEQAKKEESEDAEKLTKKLNELKLAPTEIKSGSKRVESKKKGKIQAITE